MTQDINIIIGQNIRNHRKGRSWSQQKLAKKVGITYQQVQKYETAQNAVSAAKLKKLAEILECSVQDFYYDPDSIINAEGIYRPSQMETLKINEMIGNFLKISDSPALQEHICVIVHNMALEHERQKLSAGF